MESREKACMEPLFTRNFVLCTLVSFCFTTVFFMLYTAMAGYSSDVLGVGSTVSGLVASIFIAGDLIARLAVGNRIRSFGPRRMSLICMSVGTGITLLYFVSDSVAAMCIVRFVHGMTYGAAASAINTMVAESLPVTRRGEGLGYFMLSYSFASAIGSLICMYLQNSGSYDEIFAVSAAASAAAAVLSAVLTESRRADAQKVRRTGGPRISDYIERSSLVMSLVAFVMFFSYSGVLTFIAPYSRETGLTDYSTVFFLVLSIGTIICRLFLGRIYDRHGENPALIPFLALYVAAMVMLGTVSSGAELLVSAFLIGIMIAMLSSVAQAVIIRKAPCERYGVAVSTYNVFVDLSYAVGPVVNGFSIGILGYGDNYVLMAAVGLLGLLIYLALHGIPVSMARRRGEGADA